MYVLGSGLLVNDIVELLADPNEATRSQGICPSTLARESSVCCQLVRNLALNVFADPQWLNHSASTACNPTKKGSTERQHMYEPSPR